MNHLEHDGKTVMTCSRKNVRFVLNRMIDANAKHLFDSNALCTVVGCVCLNNAVLTRMSKLWKQSQQLMIWNCCWWSHEDRKGVSDKGMDNLSVAARLVEDQHRIFQRCKGEATSHRVSNL